MWGEGAAARAGLGAPGPSFAPWGSACGCRALAASWAHLSLTQLGPRSMPMEEQRERKKITFIQLCIKLMYWCSAAALGIEKNGNL